MSLHGHQPVTLQTYCSDSWRSQIAKRPTSTDSTYELRTVTADLSCWTSVMLHAAETMSNISADAARLGEREPSEHVVLIPLEAEPLLSVLGRSDLLCGKLALLVKSFFDEKPQETAELFVHVCR